MDNKDEIDEGLVKGVNIQLEYIDDTSQKANLVAKLQRKLTLNVI